MRTVHESTYKTTSRSFVRKFRHSSYTKHSMFGIFITVSFFHFDVLYILASCVNASILATNYFSTGECFLHMAFINIAVDMHYKCKSSSLLGDKRTTKHQIYSVIIQWLLSKSNGSSKLIYSCIFSSFEKILSNLNKKRKLSHFHSTYIRHISSSS